MRVTRGKALITVFQRFLVYLCLSLAIISLSGLLSTSKTLHTENEVLVLRRSARSMGQVPPDRYRELCEDTAIQLGSEHALNLKLLRSGIPFSTTSWNEIRRKIFRDRRKNLCFIENGTVYSVITVPGIDSLVTVHIQALGSAGTSRQFPEIRRDRLIPYQTIATTLTTLEKRLDSNDITLRGEASGIDLDEWRKFTESSPDLHFPESVFIYGNHLYTISVRTEYVEQQEEFAGLKRFFLIGGVFLLLIGLFLMPRLYRSVTGVKLVPAVVVFFLDCVVIIFLAVMGFMGIEYYLVEVFHMTTLSWVEGRLGAFCFITTLFILPPIVSWQSARGIAVNEQGILSSDMIFQTFMAWSELDRLELLDDEEFSGSRRSFKVLFLHAKDDNCITIPGNIRVSAKNTIKTLLLKYVPDRLKSEMISVVKFL